MRCPRRAVPAVETTTTIGWVRPHAARRHRLCGCGGARHGGAGEWRCSSPHRSRAASHVGAPWRGGARGAAGGTGRRARQRLMELSRETAKESATRESSASSECGTRRGLNNNFERPNIYIYINSINMKGFMYVLYTIFTSLIRSVSGGARNF